MTSNFHFEKNKSSPNARKVVVVKPNLLIEIWFDKHYYLRYHLGDEKGKRIGIDPATVESLVIRSIDHSLFYSTVVRGFNFVNFDVGTEFAHRIVLKEEMEHSVLNVVIEVHHLHLTQLEITVITAMQVDDFKMPSGQFCIEIHQDNSILKKMEKGKLSEIFCL